MSCLAGVNGGCCHLSSLKQSFDFAYDLVGQAFRKNQLEFLKLEHPLPWWPLKSPVTCLCAPGLCFCTPVPSTHEGVIFCKVSLRCLAFLYCVSHRVLRLLPWWPATPRASIPSHKKRKLPISLQLRPAHWHPVPLPHSAGQGTDRACPDSRQEDIDLPLSGRSVQEFVVIFHLS